MKKVQIAINPLRSEHWFAVRDIYLEGIASGNSTFETSAPEWKNWDARHMKSCRFVASSESEILGWAALSGVSNRCVYSGVAEVSVYVAGHAQRQGVGRALLSALVSSSEQHGLWTLQAGIFPENVASIELHKQAGFRVLGIRERLGCMNGVWRDVVLMERRSNNTGL